jgi:Flp pilus assembly protein TadD
MAETIPNLLIYGRILMQGGKNEEAMELVAKSEALEPANKDVFGLKKMLLERLNRMEEARDAFESYQVFSKEEAGGAAEEGPPPEE